MSELFCTTAPLWVHILNAVMSLVASIAIIVIAEDG